MPVTTDLMQCFPQSALSAFSARFKSSTEVGVAAHVIFIIKNLFEKWLRDQDRRASVLKGTNLLYRLKQKHKYKIEWEGREWLFYDDEKDGMSARRVRALIKSLVVIRLGGILFHVLI